MDHLRIVLIILGGIFVAALLGWEWWKRRRAKREIAALDAALRHPEISNNSGAALPDDMALDPRRAEPLSGDLNQASIAASSEPSVNLGDIANLESAPAGEPGLPDDDLDRVGDVALPVSGDDQMLIVLNVMATGQHRFSGPRVLDTLERSGLEFGAMNLFHYLGGRNEGDRDVIFSVANAVEPGTLAPTQLHASSTPGLTLILQLPGPLPDITAFERMLDVGKNVAYALGGQLCDDKRSALTAQGVQLLREKILNAEELRGR
ncbi:MAG: cell division protein ZipA C-terminal FtsZ-binding domain-containing protein [Pseudomonadota bacterium]